MIAEPSKGSPRFPADGGLHSPCVRDNLQSCDFWREAMDRPIHRGKKCLTVPICNAGSFKFISELSSLLGE